MEFLKETYFTLLPIIATGLVGWVGILLKNQAEKEKAKEKETKEKYEEEDRTRKANSEALKLILRYMLNRYHTEYMVQGRITYHQYKEWMELYAAYVSLGGNSIAVEWNDNIENLDKCNDIGDMSVFESLIRKGIENKKE